MHIKRVKARNFLSIGDEWVDIDFTKLGQIVNIIGENHDYGEGASNGSGKSSILEMIVYALYGKLLKGLNHKTASHIYSKKGAELEIEVDDMKIIRKRNPDILQLFVNGEIIRDAGLPETQNEINRRLKLSYDGFVNVACFGQHSINGFLQSDAKHKREIAENLLGLDYYARYHEVAKNQRNYLNECIKELKIKYDGAAENLRRTTAKTIGLKSQQSQWIRSKQSEIQNLESRVQTLQMKISGVNGDDFSKARERLDEIIVSLSELEQKRSRHQEGLVQADEKAEAIRIERDNYSTLVTRGESQLVEAKRIHRRRGEEIRLAEETEGKKCPTCYGIIRPENLKSVIAKIQEEFLVAGKEVEKLSTMLEPDRIGLQSSTERYEKINEFRRKIRSAESLLTGQINDLLTERSKLMKIQAPDQQSLGWQRELEIIHARIDESRRELTDNDPFAKMITVGDAETNEFHAEMKRIKEEIDQKEKLLPYYEYWVKGFGDKGVRSFLLEERIPSLNKRLNFWLQILIDNRLRLTFDRDLNETIKRVPDDNKKFVYNCLSGGELSRIDLSISHAFAFITMMASKACPSLIALDEVGTNFDRPGIHAVFKMIQELSKERQVLVITHDVDLQDLLKNCDTIFAIMKNGVTKVEIKYNKN